MKRKTATTEEVVVEEVVVGVEVEEEVEKGEEVTKIIKDSQLNLIRHSNHQILKIPPQIAPVLLNLLTSTIVLHVILNLYVIIPINKILKVKVSVKKASALTLIMSIF